MNASAKDTDGTKGDMIGLCSHRRKRAMLLKARVEYELNALSGMDNIRVWQKRELGSELKLFDTKYLGLTLKDFPQMLFCGCGTELPKWQQTEGISKKTANGNSWTLVTKG
jgi:hypothetical protein